MDNVFRDHVLSSWLQFLELFILLLSITTEGYIFLRQWTLTYYLLPLFLMLLLALRRWFSKPTTNVYLMDYSCLQPPATCRVPTSAFLEHLSLVDFFDKESVAFMSKVVSSSGLGQETCFPPPLHYIPPQPHHSDSIKEAEMLLFPVLDDLLSKTNLSPRDIDVLVVNCSGFCPSPSLSSIIVNRYSMRADIKSFNLSGMGCSASAIGIDIARGLLRTKRASYAVVMSTEIMSTGWYSGKDRRKLLLNCLFRMGAAAVLVTNKREARKRSKYKLVHLVRTQRAFDDRSYRSAIREEDSEGITGFSIERDLLQVAEETLRSNAALVGASILPLNEKIRCAVSNPWKGTNIKSSLSKAPAPNFGTAVNHFCLPASGKAVIESIGRGLRLGSREMEAALATFHRFGNQSSASMWYQLAYSEAKGRVRKGEKVWQLGMGSGPKCNSLVWECVREIDGEAEKGPWAGCIDRYPLEDASPALQC